MRDPDVEAFLSAARAAGRPSFESLSVADARSQYLKGRDTVNLPSIPVGAVIDESFGGRGGPVAMRRYLPVAMKPCAQPAILFFHGGGWVIGSLETHDSICRHIVIAAGLQVIAVDYRLAPEHRFPAAVEDAIDAHATLIDRATDWGIDQDKIVLMGDSAGGGLAMVVALHARDMCLPLPIAQVLFYPVADLRGGTASYERVKEVPITSQTMLWFADHYLDSPGQAADWRASPLLAKSFASLPATFIAICEEDPLHDEGKALAARLYREGIAVTLRDLPGQIHGYLTLGRPLGEALRSIEAAATFLRGRFSAI
jgi:acetyl esterase